MGERKDMVEGVGVAWSMESSSFDLVGQVLIVSILSIPIWHKGH